MDHVKLPISKSIANRILLLQAIHGDPLMRVSSDMPDDVLVLHDALQQIRDTFGTPAKWHLSPSLEAKEEVELYLKNCGTALRFLQVHIAQCYPGAPITLTGDQRLMERDGKPTTQTISARILHGEEIPVAPGESPYITLSRRIVEQYRGPQRNQRSVSHGESGDTSRHYQLAERFGLCDLVDERDWSSAAFWYEYVAIHGGELLLEGLTSDSLQGDRIVADMYAQHFGVQTEFLPEGALISTKGQSSMNKAKAVSIDFFNCPDLYPAVALTCEKLGMDLQATGTDRLRFKESDRIEAVRLHEVRNDHRMAMALMAADWIPLPNSAQGIDSRLQEIVAKSYPGFISQLSLQLRKRDENETKTRRKRDENGSGLNYEHIVPIKGINDDGKGKKHALSKLIHAAKAEYVWLHDDDVILPPAATEPVCQPEGWSVFCQTKAVCQHSGLVILPLKMESESDEPSLLEKLQIAEYAAIQELTMRTAKAGKAVMCSGANLIVRREAWLECESELHPEIPSGDDMFLLEAMKRRGKKITVIDEPDYTAVVRPVSTWRAFLHQRMRWAGKAPKYTDPDILRCGALIVAVNLLQLLCPLIILIKFPIEYSLIKKREPRTPWYVALLLEILYPFYILISILGGLFRRNRW